MHLSAHMWAASVMRAPRSTPTGCGVWWHQTLQGIMVLCLACFVHFWTDAQALILKYGQIRLTGSSLAGFDKNMLR